MRHLLSDNLNLRLEIEEIKKKLINHDKNIELVFSYLDESYLKSFPKERTFSKITVNKNYKFGYNLNNKHIKKTSQVSKTCEVWK